ncbi:hypothetical protein AVEN_58856-1 [Araneus ventricosus]|uniref:Uncharacterized protein n=1 Tax=Araneus ventricosus TaxID=182803 RepID=A0A4Y2MGQ4_ARAVE|nr:hypothetical protein AVEN_58856-1 [Araneus ventricosus]
MRVTVGKPPRSTVKGTHCIAAFASDEAGRGAHVCGWRNCKGFTGKQPRRDLKTAQSPHSPVREVVVPNLPPLCPELAPFLVACHLPRTVGTPQSSRRPEETGGRQEQVAFHTNMVQTGKEDIIKLQSHISTPKYRHPIHFVHPF